MQQSTYRKKQVPRNTDYTQCLEATCKPRRLKTTCIRLVATYSNRVAGQLKLTCKTNHTPSLYWFETSPPMQRISRTPRWGHWRLNLSATKPQTVTLCEQPVGGDALKIHEDDYILYIRDTHPHTPKKPKGTILQSRALRVVSRVWRYSNLVVSVGGNVCQRYVA